MTAAGVGLAPAPEPRVALMVPERALLEALAVGLRDQGLRVVSVCDTSIALLESIGRAAPDVALASALGSRIGAVALARAVRLRYPEVPIALLVEDAAASVIDFEHEPIHAVLRASLTLRRVADDLRRVAAGERILPARWLSAAPEPSDPLAGLSARQREILELIANGQSSQEIAEVLHLSLNTVKYHVRKLYARLHVRNRAQAARMLHEGENDRVLAGR
jgi:DNA-binding NarL/FixJ family response regulator